MKKLFEKLGVAKNERGVISVLYFSFFVSGLTSVLLGAVLPDMKLEYQLDYSQSGALLSAHQIGSLFAMLIAGVLPYIMGMKSTVVLLGSGIALGVFVMTVTGSPAILIVAFALTGISRGTWSNVANTIVGERSKNKGAALNVLHSIFAVGALLAPLVIFIAAKFTNSGWKIASRFIAILAFIMYILVVFSKIPGKQLKKEKTRQGETKAILRSKSFWIATLILFFYLGVEASIIGWFVTYFKDTGILTDTIASFTPTIIWLMVMLGRLACAWMDGKVNKHKLILVMGALLCVFFLLMLFAKNTAVSVVSLLGIGVSMSGIYPTTFSTIKNLSSTFANGLCMSLSVIGAIIVPWLVGVVADQKGMGGGVLVILICSLLMLVVMLLNVLLARKKPVVTTTG